MLIYTSLLTYREKILSYDAEIVWISEVNERSLDRQSGRALLPLLDGKDRK